MTSETPKSVSQSDAGTRICLVVHSNIIPFKNRKRIGKTRKGAMVSYTEPKVKRHMRDLTRSFESQLNVIIRDAAMETGCSPQSLIASLLPADDSLAWIPEILVSARKVKVGQEKTTILIEKTKENQS